MLERKETNKMEESTVKEAPPAGVPLCDREDCGAPATVSYAWSWGETGVCCAAHQFLMQQTANQIDRTIQFSALLAAGPPPLDRPERIRLKSEIYALEAELGDVKARGLDMYRLNERLTGQVQALTVRGRETEAQLRDASREIERLTCELQKRDAEHGNLTDELDRLRTLAQFLDTQTEPSISAPSHG
jgi:hypothetical protein